MTRSRLALLAAGILAALSALSGCREVIRRPQARPAPWWDEGVVDPEPPAPAAQDTAATAATAEGEPEAPGRTLLARVSPADNALADTTSVATGAVPEAGRRRGAALPRPPRRVDPSPEVPAAVSATREAVAARTRDDRERVRRVNEYALWCIGRGMWDEARLHLEQALTTDTLAASLHNNLGIVYEQTGQRDRATAAYEMAIQLQPGKRLYEANLRRLRGSMERRRDEPGDSLDVADDDDLLPTDDAPPPGDPMHPNRGRDDAHRYLP